MSLEATPLSALDSITGWVVYITRLGSKYSLLIVGGHGECGFLSFIDVILYCCSYLGPDHCS